ncbi:uncharacterized protein RJT21DRAFT_51481 [Scheffersomyces amazonensis]|uniref:uncharacterized protein n=1 Tax=Scheffersomyces amazonensis TaxID=1078765 RepID=UPI00315C7428
MDGTTVKSVHTNHHQSVGLQTAWLLATLGSKVGSRKVLKSDIVSLSIPRLCQELLESHSNNNGNGNGNVNNSTQTNRIRYSSNILYGISIAYKSKVNYFLQDIGFMKNQLSREFSMFKLSNSHSLMNPLTIEDWSNNNNNNTKGNHASVFLPNDPTFNINSDLVPLIDFMFEEEEINASVKRRKLDIKSLDQDYFPDSISLNQTHYDNTLTQNSLFTSFNNQTSITHDEMLEGFLDRSLDLSTASNSANTSMNSDINLEFNEEGQLIDMNVNKEGNAQPVTEPNYGELIDNFDLEPILENVDDDIDNSKYQESRSISNDEDFGLSNSTEGIGAQLQGLELNISQSKRVKISRGKKHKLVIDPIDDLTISTDIILQYVNNYEINMANQINKPNLDHKLLLAIWTQINEELTSRYINAASRITLSKTLLSIFRADDFTNDPRSNSFNSMIKEISNYNKVDNLVSLHDLDDEIGRNIAARRRDENDPDSPLEDQDLLGDIEFTSGDYEEEQRADNSTDVFDLSFGSKDTYIRSSSRAGSNEELEELDDENEFILNMNQLVKFLDLLKSRCQKWGVTFNSSDYNFNNLGSHSIISNHDSNSETQELTKIKFSDFIPNIETARDLEESSVTRKLVANSFSMILTLATRNVIGISLNESNDEIDHENKVTSGKSIELVVNCN